MLLPCKLSTGDGKYELAVLDEDDDLENGEESQGMVDTSGLHLQMARPASLDESLLKRGVLLRLGLGWFGGVVTRRAHEASRKAYYYHRVMLEEDPSTLINKSKQQYMCIYNGCIICKGTSFPCSADHEQI